MPCPSAARAFGWLAGWRKLNQGEPMKEIHHRLIQELCRLEPTVSVGSVQKLGGLLHAGGLQSPDEQFEVAVSSATSPMNEAAVDGHRPVRARARGCLNTSSF
jgi:hypothetical protein